MAEGTPDEDAKGAHVRHMSRLAKIKCMKDYDKSQARWENYHLSRYPADHPYNVMLTRMGKGDTRYPPVLRRGESERVCV